MAQCTQERLVRLVGRILHTSPVVLSAFALLHQSFLLRFWQFIFSLFFCFRLGSFLPFLSKMKTVSDRERRESKTNGLFLLPYLHVDGLEVSVPEIFPRMEIHSGHLDPSFLLPDWSCPRSRSFGHR